MGKNDTDELLNISDAIEEIENDINNEIATNRTIDLYNKLIISQKELYKLKVDKNIKNKYSIKIMELKKALLFYYNEQVFLIKDKYNSINDRVFLIKNINPKDILIPTYYIKDINNAQDNLSLDFDSLNYLKDKMDELKENIPVKLTINESIPELNYINTFAIPNLLRVIDSYNNGNQRINKKSILIDINLIKEKLRNIIKKYPTNNEVLLTCYEKISFLDNLVNKIKINKNNKEYFILKDKIDLFAEELNKANKEDIPQFQNKYNELEKEINDKYKDKNKQLYNNLLRYLNNTKSIIDKYEIKKNDIEYNKEESNDKKIYHIETIEDSNDFYKKYDKQILLASGIASMALMNTTLGPILIPSIIFANVIAANKYPIVNKINETLAKKVNAIKGENGIYNKVNGLKINAEDAINNILKSIAIIGNNSKKIVPSLLERIKKLSIVIKTKEHITNIKNNIKTRESEFSDLKTMKLYYEFILSNKTLEDFCGTKSLNNDEFNRLIDYLRYKGNLEESKHNGR